MKTLDLKGVADLLMVCPGTVSELIHTDGLPHAKFGKAYVFVTDDVIEYIRSKYSVAKPKKCHLKNAEKFGTTLSLSQDKELESLLTPRTRQRRN